MKIPKLDPSSIHQMMDLDFDHQNLRITEISISLKLNQISPKCYPQPIFFLNLILKTTQKYPNHLKILNLDFQKLKSFDLQFPLLDPTEKKN